MNWKKRGKIWEIRIFGKIFITQKSSLSFVPRLNTFGTKNSLMVRKSLSLKMESSKNWVSVPLFFPTDPLHKKQPINWHQCVFLRWVMSHSHFHSGQVYEFQKSCKSDKSLSRIILSGGLVVKKKNNKKTSEKIFSHKSCRKEHKRLRLRLPAEQSFATNPQNANQ